MTRTNRFDSSVRQKNQHSRRLHHRYTLQVYTDVSHRLTCTRICSPKHRSPLKITHSLWRTERWKAVSNFVAFPSGPSRATAGLGKPLSRGPISLSQPHSVCAEIETPKASREMKRREGFPLTIRLGVWGGDVNSARGVRGGVSAENEFFCIFEIRNKPSETPFSVFLNDDSPLEGPPNVAGPGKLSRLSPLSTGLITTISSTV